VPGISDFIVKERCSAPHPYNEQWSRPN